MKHRNYGGGNAPQINYRAWHYFSIQGVPQFVCFLACKLSKTLFSKKKEKEKLMGKKEKKETIV